MGNIIENQNESILMGLQELEELRDSLEGKDRDVLDCILLFAAHISAGRLPQFMLNAIEEIENADIYNKLLQIATTWDVAEGYGRITS